MATEDGECFGVIFLNENADDVVQQDDLDASGIDVVLATSLYAIIGAIALQKGGAVASRVARERILKPLGIS